MIASGIWGNRFLPSRDATVPDIRKHGKSQAGSAISPPRGPLRPLLSFPQMPERTPSRWGGPVLVQEVECRT
jgi:hypothetical protein